MKKAIMFDLLNDDTDLDAILMELDTSGNYNIPATREFKSVEAEDVDRFLKENVNPQTRRKTESDMKLFQQFLLSKGEARNVEYIPPDQLNDSICAFLLAVTKKNGQEYEPSSLRGIISSLDRHLRDSGSKVCIIRDVEFAKTRNVLTMKQKDLKSKGLGNKPKTAEPLTEEHLNKMYKSKTLGDQNPNALFHSMWLICSTYFGMRTGQEAHSLRWGDVTLGQDETCGREYIQLDTERQTKTRTGANPKDTRLVKPRAYAIRDDAQKDPVNLYRKYQEKRPVGQCTDDSAFFLQPGCGRQLSWFKNTAVGINKLYNVMNEMKEAAGIKDPRITPYSARKRLMQKLNDDGVPPNQIIQISGHKNVNSLNNYSKLNTEQTKNISDILSNKKQRNEAPSHNGPMSLDLEPRKCHAPTSTVTLGSGSFVQDCRPTESLPQVPPGFFVNPVFNGPVHFNFSSQSLSQLTTKNKLADVQLQKSPVSAAQHQVNDRSVQPISDFKRQRLVSYSDSE